MREWKVFREKASCFDGEELRAEVVNAGFLYWPQWTARVYSGGRLVDERRARSLAHGIDKARAVLAGW